MSSRRTRLPCNLPLSPLALSLTLSSGLLLAPVAKAVQALPAVEVSASPIQDSAFSVSPEEARDTLQQTPGGVGLVEADDYLTGRAGTMEDSLKLATGVFITSRFGSDEARVAIRGSGLQRTFHGRGLQLLQDGVPVNLADGSFDMQAIEPQATRYIEIERGANALRYGGGTLGGALNYISQTGRTAPGLAVRAEAGSDDYQRYNLSAGAHKDTLDGYASLNAVTQDGFRDHARQENYRFFGNAGLQLSERIESRLYLTAVDVDSELPGNLTYAELKSNPAKANTRAVSRDQHRDFVLYRLASRTQITHASGNVSEISGYAAHKQLYHPIEFFPTGPGLIEQDNRDWGLGLRHVITTTWAGAQQEHIAGVQWHHGLTLDERYTYANNTFVPGIGFAVGNQRGTLDNRQKQTADTINVYGQSRWQFTPQLTALAGVQSSTAFRRQTVVVDNTGFDPVTGAVRLPTGAVRLPTGSYEQRYQRTSPRLGVIYQASPALEWFGNLSGSFEPPSFAETLNSQPLRAQRAMTTELGARSHSRQGNVQLGWDISLYHASLHNELLEIALNGGQPATVNANQTVHQGIEAGLSASADRWRLIATALYNDFHFDNDATFGRNAIAGLPDQVLTAETAIRLPRSVWIGPTVRAASRSWVDHANTTAAPGYTVYGLKIDQDAGHGLSWFVEGRNLTDKRYAATTGVVRDYTAAGTNQAQFSPGDGRSLYVGVSKVF